MSDCTFIILGATGDLAKKKLLPAIYDLVKDKKIARYAIIGAALEDLSQEEFTQLFASFINPFDFSIWDEMKEHIYYQRINFEDPKSFIQLNKKVSALESEAELPGNRIIYIAAASIFYCSITQNLAHSSLARKATNNSPWNRIIYEKPFGTDLDSANQINQCIKESFNESQIYRVDHYLTKELVSSIVLVRFSNIIFEPLWNHKYIDYVEINLGELIGLEGRGRYYDHYGVLRDVVQNHGLQLMSLIAMELPAKLNGFEIQEKKAEVLKHIQFDDGFLGQYDSYKEELDVNISSSTPTFACLKFIINNDRWKNIPFYIKAGKKLNRKDSSIHIKFKNVDCTLKESCFYESDYLTIQVDPDAAFSLQLNSKRPDSIFEVRPIQLTFNQDYTSKTATPEAYEVLLERIIQGDQSVSVRFDEIEFAWSVIDTVQKKELPMYPYEQATKGPQEALTTFERTHKMRWRV